MESYNGKLNLVKANALGPKGSVSLHLRLGC